MLWLQWNLWTTGQRAAGEGEGVDEGVDESGRQGEARARGRSPGGFLEVVNQNDASHAAVRG